MVNSKAPEQIALEFNQDATIRQVLATIASHRTTLTNLITQGEQIRDALIQQIDSSLLTPPQKSQARTRPGSTIMGAKNLLKEYYTHAFALDVFEKKFGKAWKAWSVRVLRKEVDG